MDHDQHIAREPQPLTDGERAYVLDRLAFVREAIESGAACVISNDGPMTIQVRLTQRSRMNRTSE